MSQSSNEIYIPAGKHFIKFVEYLNDDGSLHGVAANEKLSLNERIEREINLSEESVVKASYDDTVLLMFTENFTIENVTIDCRNVRTGILLRKGSLTLINCTMIGDHQSSTSIGLTVMGKSFSVTFF